MAKWRGKTTCVFVPKSRVSVDNFFASNDDCLLRNKLRTIGASCKTADRAYNLGNRSLQMTGQADANLAWRLPEGTRGIPLGYSLPSEAILISVFTAKG